MRADEIILEIRISDVLALVLVGSRRRQHDILGNRFRRLWVVGNTEVNLSGGGQNHPAPSRRERRPIIFWDSDADA